MASMFENLSKSQESLRKQAEDAVYRAKSAATANQACDTGDIRGGALGRAVRTPLLDRVRRRYEVEREDSHAGSIRAMQYEELLRLLEIHPDVARILDLDLMEALRESGGLR